MSEYDVLVVGGGAAGLSAAIVLARAQRTVLVVDGGEPRNAPATHMHGFLSRDGMPPGDLLAAGRQEVKAYGGDVVEGRVEEAFRDQGAFTVRLDGGATMTARRLLVATGLRDELPDVGGLRERWARDVLHCPYCHGYEVRGQRFGVLGWSPDALRYAQIIRQWSDDVIAPLSARGIDVVQGEVERVVIDDDRLSGLALTDGRVVARDVVFVPPRFVPNNDVLGALGCAVDDAGWVITDSTGRTSMDGVWAAGNVCNPRAQVITAAGEGSTAAIAMNADLVEEEVRNAVLRHRAGPKR
jgi:thioredoxin reductase